MRSRGHIFRDATADDSFGQFLLKESQTHPLILWCVSCLLALFYSLFIFSFFALIFLFHILL